MAHLQRSGERFRYGLHALFDPAQSLTGVGKEEQAQGPFQSCAKACVIRHTLADLIDSRGLAEPDNSPSTKCGAEAPVKREAAFATKSDRSIAGISGVTLFATEIGKLRAEVEYKQLAERL